MSDFICLKCLKCFNTKANLNQHLNKKIPCDKPKLKKIYRCDICLVDFSSNAMLKYHKNKKISCKPALEKLQNQIFELKKTINNKKMQEQEKINNNMKTKHEKSNDSGYIYLIQPVLLLDTTKYKFGCSTLKDNSRLKHYGKDATLHFKYECKNPFKIEKYILEKLSENYEKIQHEYFNINDIEVVDVVKNILIWILEFEK